MDKYSHLDKEYLEYLKEGYSQRYIDADDPWFTNYELEDRYLEEDDLNKIYIKNVKK
jgi:hypothetical protein